MQTSSIWSRTKPKVSNLYRRCRCYTCLAHPEHAAVLRRPTTAVQTGQWRKLTTLFYSTLFATAAAADVQVKQSRRDQWDAAIASAEDDIKDAQRRGNEHSHKISITAQAEELLDIEASGLEDEDRHRRLVRAVAAGLRAVGASTVPVPYGLQNREPGRDSIYASEDMRQRSSQWTPKKLAMAELAMAKLTLVFAMAIPEAQQQHSAVRREYLDFDDILRDVKRKMEAVKSQSALDNRASTRAGLPQYVPNARTGSPLHRNTPLDATLAKLKRSFDRGDDDLSTFLQKVSRNLLASRYPPEVSSMTMILNTLSQHKHFELADAVCDSIFDSKIRLDEICLDAMINHYAAARNRDGFERLRLKMEGYHGGLGIAKQLRISKHSASRLRQHNGKTFQCIEKDSVLWSSILKGQLEFGDIRNALKTLQDLTFAGQAISTSVASAFLKAAATAKDFELGISFWGLIQPKISKVDDQHRSLFLKAYAHVVKLCQICGPEDELQRLLAEQTRYHETETESITVDDPRQCSSPQQTQILRRRIRVIARQADLENIRFQRRARGVMGSQLSLAGWGRQQIIDLFNAVSELQPEAQAALDAPESLYARYWRNVKATQRIRDSYERRLRLAQDANMELNSVDASAEQAGSAQPPHLETRQQAQVPEVTSHTQVTQATYATRQAQDQSDMANRCDSKSHTFDFGQYMHSDWEYELASASSG